MDINVTAFRIVQKTTNEDRVDEKMPAGRAGGQAGGPARAKKLTPVQRREIAIKASRARWA